MITMHRLERDAYNKELLARVAFLFDPDGIIVELTQQRLSAKL